jgi:hypothetical protein
MTIDHFLIESSYHGEIFPEVVERLGKVKTTSEVYRPYAKTGEVQIEATYQGIYFEGRELEAKVTVVKEELLPGKEEIFDSAESSINIQLTYLDTGEEIIPDVNSGRRPLFGRTSPFKSQRLWHRGYTSDVYAIANEFLLNYWINLLKEPMKNGADFVSLAGELIRVYVESKERDDLVIQYKGLNFVPQEDSLCARTMGRGGIKTLADRIRISNMSREEFRNDYCHDTAAQLWYHVNGGTPKLVRGDE